MPPNARVYRDIDQLAASGLIDTIVAGTRPYTEREVARLLNEARRNLRRLRSGAAWEAEIIAADLAYYAPHANRPFDDASAEAASMSSPYRPAPADPNGTINAAINPFADFRGGRPLANGQTLSLETMHTAVVGPHFAFAFNPRLSALRLAGGQTEGEFRVQSASASALFGNLLIDAGREYALFGPAPTGGLLLSENAPPMDMVRISNERPAALPSFFRWLGPLKGTLFVADLGTADQVFSHSKLVGYHVTVQPHPRFEFGVQVVDETGGAGAPPASFADRAEDAIPLIDAVFRSHSDFLFSNKIAGIDALVRVPELAGLVVYGEGAVDDFDARRLHSSLFEDGGYIAGLSLACLAECGRFGVRAEYHQTGIRYYTHDQFTSGVQDNGIILGDPLGPRGLGTYVTVDGQSNRLGTVSLTTAYEVRSGNRYGSETDSAGEDFRFVLVQRRPGEHRARAVATWSSGTPAARTSVSLSAGLERVTDFAFVAGNARTNALAQVRFELRQ